MKPPISGPLTMDDLLAVWRGALDREYREPYERAGEGRGLEIHTQMLDQFVRVSEAIDATTQAMYILPWSGQTDEPASGVSRSRVTLSILRSTGELARATVLEAGQILIDEIQTDFSPTGPVEVETGRRYRLVERLVFHPGDMGPYDVTAEAVRPGRGYDNPLPGTLKSIDQPGANFSNTRGSVETQGPFPASLAAPSAQVVLVGENQPDMPIPDHVGSYFFLTAGANAGAVARARTYYGPVPPLRGSAVELVLEESFEATTFSGSFFVDELVVFRNGAAVIAYGTLLGSRVQAGRLKVTWVWLSGAISSIVLGSTVATGVVSGATATVLTTTDLAFVPESGTVDWRLLPWGIGLGITVTNTTSPTGGRAGMLDELGAERAVGRASGEPDEIYRPRVSTPADVVSPNAIVRALIRTLGSIPFCFREVGTELLRGFFYDGDLAPVSTVPHGENDDAYDFDTFEAPGGAGAGVFVFQEPVEYRDAANNVLAIGYMGRILSGISMTVIRRGLNPTPTWAAGQYIIGLESGATWIPTATSTPASVVDKRWRLYFDYEQFRSFFLVGLPPLGVGEFGMAYDVGTRDAFDVDFDVGNFYDGYPYQNSFIYGRAYAAVAAAKMGGVGFEFYQERYGCTP